MISLRLRGALLAAFVGAFAWLLAPETSAMGVSRLDPVVWDTADGGNGNTYLLVPLPRTVSWATANELAQMLTLPDGTRGYLATVTSDAELAFIREEVLPNTRGRRPRRAVWIAPENQYLLVARAGRVNGVSPEHWSYSKWSDENEPGGYGSIGKRFLNGNGGKKHGPNDGCDHWNPPIGRPKIVGMIVEFDTSEVPEPAAALLAMLGLALYGFRRR